MAPAVLIARSVLSFLILALSAGLVLAQQQDDEAGPLKGTYKLGNSAELVLLWADGNRSGNHVQSLYDYLNLNNPDPNVENEIVRQDSQVVESDGRPENDEALSIISGDFDGDALDDYIAAWEGPDHTIEMIIPDLDRENLRFLDPHFVTLTDTGAILDEPDFGRAIRLAEGDFDDDAASEFVLAYWGADQTLQIELYETNESHIPTQLTAFSDPDIEIIVGSDQPGTLQRSTPWFDVTTGDFDGDQTDEIIATGARPFDCSFGFGCWTVFSRIYDVHPETYQLVQRADTTFFRKENNSNEFVNGIVAQAGRYGPEFEQGAAVLFEWSTNENEVRWYLTASRVILARNEDGGSLEPENWGSAADTSYFRFGPNGTEQIHQTRGSRGFAASAAAIDFQRDGLDELVLHFRQTYVYEFDAEYRFNRVGSAFGSESNEDGRRHMMTVADLDADNDLMNESSKWLPEIIIVGNRDVSDDGGISTDGILEIEVIAWDPDLNTINTRTLGTLRDHRIGNSGERPVGIVAIDVGDNGIRVGSPRRFAKTEIVRPLVILNAPPTHFDVFEEEQFDVNMCYGETDCACQLSLSRCFQAEYETETERSITMETELVTDWSVAVTAEGGFDLPIPFTDALEIGVDISITGTYGEGFRRTDAGTETFTVRQTIEATRDDWIYAMIVNYDMWEYPLYVSGAQTGNILIVTPKLQTRAWFDSKSWNAFDHIPYHEVGNILSYRSLARPEDNSSLAQAIRWNTGDQITLSSTSDASWELTAENETETEVENSVNMGINGSADFDIPIPFIPNISVDGDYSTETVNTRNVYVRDRKGLKVVFGNVDQGIGNVRYNVIPYVYWATNGALVLDYAVNPELSQPGFEGTWWQHRYGEKSDPAFVLPWRWDREKGADLSEAQTQQTRDIIFNPIEPDVGDVVTISARVRNWSLLPTPGPVEVRFFVGDPAAGGTPIVGTDGQDFVMAEQLESRGSAVVRMDWELPAGVGFFPRIYAVIDSPDSIDEIHEANNKGWTVLNISSGSTDIDDERPGELPREITLHQNYPNPFNPSTTIAFDLPNSKTVRIDVFDVMGRRVATLVDSKLSAGSYNVHFDASLVPSGAYVYRLVAGETVKTRRMVVVK